MWYVYSIEKRVEFNVLFPYLFIFIKVVNRGTTRHFSAELFLIWRSIFIQQVSESVARCLPVKWRFHWTSARSRGFAFMHSSRVYVKSNLAMENCWNSSGRACRSYAYQQKISKQSLKQIPHNMLFLSSSVESTCKPRAQMEHFHLCVNTVQEFIRYVIDHKCVR